jgi:glycosyltransferase involved in cell wall biosynthesis
MTVEPSSVKYRAIVFGAGVGVVPPLVERFRTEYDVVEFCEFEPPTLFRWSTLMRSFSLHREVWRRRWIHRLEKTPVAFRLHSQLKQRYLERRIGQYDFIINFGAMDSPGTPPVRPLIIVTDSTRKLSSANSDDVVSHFDTEEERAQFFALEGMVYRRASRIFVGSEFVRSSLINDYGVDSSRVIACGFGAGLGYGAEYQKSFDGRTVLFIGKGDFEKKGGHTLLEAFKRVRAAIPSAELGVVGQEHLPAQPGVTNHGFIRDRSRLVQLMQQAHVFTLPSLVDRNPITVLEAMAAATPCVTSDYGAIPELVGDAGIVVPRNDPEALGRALIQLLTDASEARQLGENGRRRFTARYNWDVIWQTMRAEISRALAESADGGRAPRKNER